MCAGAGVPRSKVNGGSASTWGPLQAAHGCVEKTADEQGVLRGVEQSTIEADGGAIIGLMHGHSTNGSSRDLQQQATGFERRVAGLPGSATLIRKCCGVSAGAAALVQAVGGRWWW